MGYTKQDARVKHNEKYKVAVPTLSTNKLLVLRSHFHWSGEAVNSKYILGWDSNDQGFLIPMAG